MSTRPSVSKSTAIDRLDLCWLVSLILTFKNPLKGFPCTYFQCRSCFLYMLMYIRSVGVILRSVSSLFATDALKIDCSAISFE